MSSLKDRIAAQRAQIAQKQASFVRAYKFKQGKTVIRILPGCKVEDEFSREYGAHYIKDPATDAMICVVGDAEITYGKPDPIRDAVTQLVHQANNRGDTDLSVKFKSWLAKSTNVINAQIISGDDENKGKVVQPEVSGTLLDQICSAIQDLIEVGDLTDLSKGVMITIERKGTGVKDTRYTASPFLKQPENVVPKDVLAARVDLDDYVDGKFGASVTKALAHLSVMLGRDVTQTSLGAAMADTSRLSGPASTVDLTLLDEVAEEKAASEAAVVDAVIDEDHTPPAASKPTASEDEFASIMAELEDL